ncbi:MAG: S8 family serine peptidase [Reyranella sp.]|nr:S8 family serine peptidase [Reyranella sp.]
MTLGASLTVIAILPFSGSDVSLLSDDGASSVAETSSVVARVSSYFLTAAGRGDSVAVTLRNPTANVPLGHLAVPFGTEPNILGPRRFPRLGLIVGAVDPAGLEKMRNDPDVVDVVPAVAPKMMYNVELLEDGGAQRSWSLDFLRIPDLWNKGITGKGLAIGHLDSGVAGDHPALKRPLKAFAVIDSTGGSSEGGAASDSHGHGTHTAGILCAQPMNGVTVGIAPDASLFCCQITGEGALMRLLGGLEWLLGKNVRLISLSAGVQPFNPVFQAVIDRLRLSNILPIVAIGNEYAGSSYSPANYRNALGVGSISDQSNVADSSCSQNFGEPPPYSKPDLVAPGVGILSTRRFGGYEMRSGTSQATPCVVGIAALLMQAFPNATIAEIEQRIIRSCRKINGEPASRQGHGIVNPVTALSVLSP